MKTLVVIVVLALAVSPAFARGKSNVWSAKAIHATKATRAASSGKHIAALVYSHHKTASAHVSHGSGNGTKHTIIF